MARTKVSRTSRQVLEGQLLTALDDKSKVAVLLNEEDLRRLIMCVRLAPDGWGEDWRGQLIKDLERLAKEAFGKK